MSSIPFLLLAWDYTHIESLAPARLIQRIFEPGSLQCRRYLLKLPYSTTLGLHFSWTKFESKSHLSLFWAHPSEATPAFARTRAGS